MKETEFIMMITQYYKRCRIWLLSLVLLLTAPVLGRLAMRQSPAFREKQAWAVAVAIAEYADAQGPDLPEAVEIAESLISVLLEQYKYEKGNIQQFYNERATKESIFEFLFSIGERSSPDDSIFIYLDAVVARPPESFESMHGPEWPTYLVPFDGRKDNFKTLIGSEELYYFVERYFPTQSVFIVINGSVEPPTDRQRSVKGNSPRSYSQRTFQILSLSGTRGSDSRSGDLGRELTRVLNEAKEPVSARDIHKVLSGGKRTRISLESLTDSPAQFVFEVQGDPLSRERLSSLLNRSRSARERIEQINELIASIKASLFDNIETRLQVLDVLFEVARDRSDDSGVRRQAIWAIGQLKDPKSVDTLKRLFARTSDSSLRRSILDTLLELDPDSALPLLRITARDENSGLATYALRGLALLEDKESLSIVEGLIEKTDNTDVLTSALDALPSLGAEGRAVQATLRRLFTHPESSIRRQAIRTLTRIREDSYPVDSESIDAVVRVLLEDNSRDVRRTAAYALGQLHTPEETDRIMPPLIKILDDREPEVRAAAAYSLGRIRATEATDELSALAIDDTENQNVRVAAMEALGEIGITRGAEKIFMRLVREGKSPEIRLAAVKALSSSKNPEVAGVLLQAVGDSDFYVAKAAGEALLEISAKNPDDFVNMLNQMDIQNPEPDAQVQVIRSLSKIENSNTVDLLIKKLESTSIDVRKAAIASLSNFKAEDSIEIIVKHLSSPNPLVRSGIAAILGNYQRAKLVPVLIDRLSTERDDDVRAEIIRSLMNYDTRDALEAVSNIADQELNRSTALAVAAFFEVEADRRAVREDFSSAMQLAERALLIRRRVGPLEYANGLNNIGGIFARQEKYDQALKNHKQALSYQSKELPSEDVRLALTRRQIGRVLVAMKDFRNAENYLLEALSIFQRVLGPDHLEVSSTFKELARLYNSMGELERSQSAERQYRQSSSRRYEEKLFAWAFQGWIGYRTQYALQSVTGKWLAELNGKTALEPDEKKLFDLFTRYIDVDTRSEQMRASELKRTIKELDLPMPQLKK